MFPLIAPGVAGTGLTVTASVCGEEVPQELEAVTVIFPPLEPAVVLMEVLVLEPLQPEGNTHVYEVAPETATILKVLFEPWQTVAFPLIVPGVPGMGFTVTASVRGIDEPQALFAVTLIFPLDAPAVALIELEVDVPVHPEGSIQV